MTSGADQSSPLDAKKNMTSWTDQPSQNPKKKSKKRLTTIGRFCLLLAYCGQTTGRLSVGAIMKSQIWNNSNFANFVAPFTLIFTMFIQFSEICEERLSTVRQRAKSSLRPFLLRLVLALRLRAAAQRHQAAAALHSDRRADRASQKRLRPGWR